MLSDIAPGSLLALELLAVSLVLVLAFEFSNGFHDTANAVATVIYSHALPPLAAVVLSGILNFAGVLLGGLAVAFTLIDLIPPDVLTPPDGNPALGMLMSLFASAIVWNVGTWYFGIPCSSSHALIGAILGVALAHQVLPASAGGTGLGLAWTQVRNVGAALLFSPLAGFVLAGILFRVLKFVVRDPALYKPPQPNHAPPWWTRALLICTCSLVSFSHGSNDGQKSIGLIMLTVIGLAPVQYALNPALGSAASAPYAEAAERAAALIERQSDPRQWQPSQAVGELVQAFRAAPTLADLPAAQRRRVRGDVYMVTAELGRMAKDKDARPGAQREANALRSQLKSAVEYAPWWVRVVSALCLGLGTMVGYRRIVKTLGERIGHKPLTPGQGASAELVGAGLIATAAWHGLPVSTTHIVSSGVAGTMAVSRAGIQPGAISAIVLAWVLTLPATVLISGGLFYILG